MEIISSAYRKQAGKYLDNHEIEFIVKSIEKESRLFCSHDEIT